MTVVGKGPAAMIQTGTQPEDFDLVVIGSGEGAKFLAWTLAKQGQRVAVVEQRWIGGSCPNIACLPSKNIIHSAKIASYFAKAGEFGIETAGYAVDMRKVINRKRAMVKGLVDIHVNNFKNSGVDLILGHGHFAGPRLVEVDLKAGGKRWLLGKKVVIGAGTHASLDAIPGLKEANPLTHIEALELEQVPSHLLIIGGGYIGLEFAQAMRRLGSRVSLLDRNATLLHREDPDSISEVESLFRDEGIELLLNVAVEYITGTSGESVEIAYRQNGEAKSIQGSHILVAMGRTPNTQGLGAELAGVELTDRGYVKVNDRLESTAEGVWAVGEVAGSPQFTHIAFDDFRILRDNFSGGNRSTKGRLVPFTLFTDPELARVGLSEKEAKAMGISYRLFKTPMATVLRARTLSETRGFMKALIAEENDQILGFTAFGVNAGEIMGAVQLVMLGNLPFTSIRDAILAHPTLMEGLIALFSTVPAARKAPFDTEHEEGAA